MKKVNFILLAIAIVFISSANAQELKKKVLGIESFTYSSTFSPADVEIVRNQIIAAIQQTGRVIVTDHSAKTKNALNSEAERRKQESAMDANTVADMSTLNANSLLYVALDQLTTSREIHVEYEYIKQRDDKIVKREKGRYPYYTAVIVYTIKIIDCETGAVQCQKTFEYSDGKYNVWSQKADYNSSEEAKDGIVRSCVNQKDITALIFNTFKTQGKILQVAGGSKKAKAVYVNLGAEDGIKVKQVLEVYNEIDIAGEISKKYVGEIEVIEIMGASRCLAKVKKGGDVIQQVISDGGNMPVQSR